MRKPLKNWGSFFIDKADIKHLYSTLRGERPQTIALVLSYVDADKAADVVTQLEEEKQSQVVESIAKLESASPVAIKIAEAEMHNRFSNIMTDTNIKVGGIGYVADVMNNQDRTSEKNIFDGLAHQELADEIRKRMFVGRPFRAALRLAAHGFGYIGPDFKENTFNEKILNVSTRMARCIKEQAARITGGWHSV